MKIAAFLCGILASAFAWAAGVFLADLSPQFLALWPDSISQQFLGLAVWHVIVATGVVGGALAVISPISGAILLLLATAAWAWLASMLPVGFSPQMLVPLGLNALGALAAIGAMIRGGARRAAEEKKRPSLEDLAREEALSLEPSALAAGGPFDLSEALASDRADVDDRPAMAPPVERPAPTRRGRDDAPPRGISGLFVANVAALVLLTGAVAILLYVEYRSGELFAAFAPTGPRPAHVSEGVPRIAGQGAAGEERAVEVAEAGGPVVPPPAEGGAAGAGQPEADPSIPPHVDELQEIATASATGATAADETWHDPFAYCAAVGTIDAPDHRYAGPRLTDAIANALEVPAATSADRVKWRCADGGVLGCKSTDWPVCSVTPSVSEMVAYCAQNPGTKGLRAPNGQWSCDGTRPTIPPGENWPVDSRGFLPSAWVPIPPTTLSATTG